MIAIICSRCHPLIQPMPLMQDEILHSAHVDRRTTILELGDVDCGLLACLVCQLAVF